jgi:hypothetical protein
MLKAGRNFIKYAIQSNQGISKYDDTSASHAADTNARLPEPESCHNLLMFIFIHLRTIDTTANSYTGGRDNCQQLTTPFYKQYLTPRLDWIWVHYLGVKRTESEADYSQQSSADVKHTWRFNSSPHYILFAVRLSKEKTSALNLKKKYFS